MSMVNRDLLGIVLCGGRSSRMGMDKGKLLHPNGVTFLEHAKQRIGEVCELVFMSGHTDDETNFPTLADPVTFRGPATGVAMAVDFAAGQGLAGCLVTPVDMPNLTSHHLRKLVDCWQHSRSELVCLASECDNRIEPLVSIYPVCFRDELSELAESEHRSLSRWINARKHAIVTVPPAACKNVNTPDEIPNSRRRD
ncbi:molybdopterin-guanine dinucleotide biosynthesis protein MobA [Planctomycetes bacterium CA13]|uniref:Molybdopterin-guanine dinucleotide biosynthesis protein MobA n=1 Tax=Novipirellula herctigrandis TaxID=2527986 RepID=A0A5C5Z0W0_9BACT|nr:molybdopterin-guanine dinucleotide biosynthesis protein MobA [Planctomycetes bacterium CA13]